MGPDSRQDSYSVLVQGHPREYICLFSAPVCRLPLDIAACRLLYWRERAAPGRFCVARTVVGRGTRLIARYCITRLRSTYAKSRPTVVTTPSASTFRRLSALLALLEIPTRAFHPPCVPDAPGECGVPAARRAHCGRLVDQDLQLRLFLPREDGQPAILRKRAVRHTAHGLPAHRLPARNTDAASDTTAASQQRRGSGELGTRGDRCRAVLAACPRNRASQPHFPPPRSCRKTRGKF